MKQDLIRVSTYARQINKSVDWVYKLIRSGKIECEEIDGTKFIKVNQVK